MATTTTTDAEAKRYAFYDLPRCPICGSAHLRAYRTTRRADSIQRHTECQGCGHKFLLILE